MIKVHFPEFDQEAVLRAAGGKIITLIDPSVNSKTAASSGFSEEFIAANRPDDDHFGIHFIAIGDHERTGSNRNEDSFTKESNIRCHKTFETHGHFFREHNNSSPKLKIGDLNAAAYNEKMGRIEVIAHGSKRLAEEEYELAKAGKPLSCSMGVKMAFDRCSICGNKSPTPATYCDHLKNHLGEYLPEHKKFAFAFNDNNVFFDLSRVKNPADRIAHHISYMLDDKGHSKAASVDSGRPLGGAKLAEYLNMTEEPTIHFTLEETNILQKLAAEESYLARVARNAPVARDSKYAFVKHALHLLISSDQSTDAMINPLRGMDLPIMMQKLMAGDAMLPFKSFYSLINDESVNTLDVDPTFLHSSRDSVPSSFRMIISGTSPVAKIDDAKSFFEPAGEYTANSCSCSDEAQKAIDHFIEEFSMKQVEEPKYKLVKVLLEEKPSLSREFRAKEAAVVDYTKAKLSADLYALYKLSHIKHTGANVDEPRMLTIAYFQ